LLIPVWKGWNLAQLIMALSASIGIGIGNMVWAGFNTEAPPAMIAVPTMQPLTELAQPIVEAHTCLANRWADQARLRKANVDSSAPDYLTNWDRQMLGGSAWVGIAYGAIPAADGYDESTCGLVTVDFPQTASDDPDVLAIITTARQAMSTALARLDTDVAQLIAPAKTMDPDDSDQVVQLEKTIQAALPELVAQRQAELDAAIAAVVRTTNNRAREKMDELSRKYGWLGAGGAPLIALVGNMQIQSATPKVAATAPKSNPETPTVQPANAAYRPDYGRNQAAQTAAARRKAEAAGGSCGLTSMGKDYFARCVEKPLITKIQSHGVGSIIGASSGNPIAYSQQLGFAILGLVSDISTWFFVAIAGLAILAAWSGPTVPAAGSVLAAGINVFGILLAIVLVPLTIFAVQLTVMVPLMLTLSWIMAVGAWLVVVAESLIAATLWGLVHLDPEGEGMGKRTAHGYIFMLNLLFRPAILVFAMFFALRFCDALGNFANGLIGEAIAKMLAGAGERGWFIFLVTLAGGAWVTTNLNIRIVGVAASLLHIIPNQIFTWIGGRFGSDVGSGVGTDVADGAGRSLAAAGNNASQGISRAASQATRGSGSDAGKPEAPVGIDKKLEEVFGKD
ncbi:MAG: DotA/TraY family protein, partial [Betaproteobacteria bacterium]|nr:DotA/TraY family protein [Betaproteobacteria bacterium]